MKHKRVIFLTFLFFLIAGILTSLSSVQAQTLPTDTLTSTVTPTPTETATPNDLNTSIAPIETALPPGVLPVTGTPAPGTPGTSKPETGTPGMGTPETNTPAAEATKTPGSAPTPTSTANAAPTYTPIPVVPVVVNTPPPGIIQVQPLIVARQFVQAGLVGLLGLGIALLVQKILFKVLERAHPEIRLFAGRFTFVTI